MKNHLIQKKSSEELINQKPSQVKLILKMRQEKMAEYYAFADAILGEMKTGHTNSIEREAALCKKPVLNYNNTKWSALLDEKEISTPFLPTSQDPKKIAEVIDNVVNSSDFRNQLAEKEFNFMKELTNPFKAAAVWDDLFEKLHDEHKSLQRKSFFLKRVFRILFFVIANNLYIRNIENKLP